MNDKPNGHIDLDAIEEGFAADAGPDPLATHPADDDRILAIEAERDDYRDRFMRALADAENARKRADKDRREAENYGGSRLARDLLPDVPHVGVFDTAFHQTMPSYASIVASRTRPSSGSPVTVNRVVSASSRT